MATGLQDIYRGDTKRYKISIPGVDLSNDSFKLTCKENDDDADPGVYQISKKPIHNDTGDDPINGVVYITVPSASNALLVPGTHYWIGIQWETSAGWIKTILKSKIKCLQDITITTG